MKSYTSQDIASNVVEDKHVGIVNLEMNSNEVGYRIDAIGAKDISNQGMMYGTKGINLQEYKAALEDRAQRTEKGIWITDSTQGLTSMSTPQVIAKIDHYVRRFGEDFGLMIVDYVTLLEDASDDWRDIKKASNRLKAAAMRYKVPILLLAQARRGTAGRVLQLDDIAYGYSMTHDILVRFTRDRVHLIGVLCHGIPIGDIIKLEHPTCSASSSLR